MLRRSAAPGGARRATESFSGGGIAHFAGGGIAGWFADAARGRGLFRGSPRLRSSAHHEPVRALMRHRPQVIGELGVPAASSLSQSRDPSSRRSLRSSSAGLVGAAMRSVRWESRYWGGSSHPARPGLLRPGLLGRAAARLGLAAPHRAGYQAGPHHPGVVAGAPVTSLQNPAHRYDPTLVVARWSRGQSPD